MTTNQEEGLETTEEELRKLSQDKVNSLLRRFNHQVHHIQLARHDLPTHRFDFQTAPDEEFHAARLRSNLQRFFLVCRDIRSAARHVSRLRSWEDTQRTGTICAAYFVAWLSPMGVCHFLVISLILSIVSPAFRRLCFPSPSNNSAGQTPIPPLASSSAPGVHPSNRVSLSSVPEEEQDDILARDFTEGMTELALGTSTSHSHPGGFHDDGDLDGSSITGDSASDVDTDSETVIIELERREGHRTAESGAASDGEVDKKAAKHKRRKLLRVRKDEGKTDGTTTESGTSTPPPVKMARVERFGLPLQRNAGKIADSWEKWVNCFSPPSPFPESDARMRLLKYLLPIPILGMIFSPGALASALSFLLGVLFFGKPLFGLLAEILDANVERWRERWRDRHTMLDSAPTDLQVTIRLLRDAERARCPLRPPPPLPKRSKSMSASFKLSSPDTAAPRETVTPSASTDTLSSLSTALPQASQSTSALVRRRSFPETASPEATDLLLPSPEELSPAPSIKSAKSSRPFFGTRKSSFFFDGGAAAKDNKEKEKEGKESSLHKSWERMSKKAADRVKTATAKLDFSERLKLREQQKEELSLSNFFAQRGGIPGHLVITPPGNSEGVWTLSFVRLATFSTSSLASLAETAPTASHMSNFTIAINDITALKKVAGMGWQRGKMAYELLVGSSAKPSRAGIKISWVGKTGKLTTETFRAISKRDELFNRLASIGNQRFENM
ncbi:hypothetical protein T439DRAFT_323840 [Meredithblackwellia eburnea MCA 4105]